MNNDSLTIREAQDNDKEAWDHYVAHHPDASPYHLFAWKRAVEDSYGHRCHYLMAEKDGEVAGVIPLIRLKIPFLLDELVALPFCDLGGPLITTPSSHAALLKTCFDLKKRIGAKSLLLRGDLQVTEEQCRDIYQINHDKVRMILSLPDSSEALLKGFKSKLRSQVRKAEKNNLVFQWSSSSDLNHFYAVFSENMRNLGSPVHSKRWFKNILHHYQGNSRMGIVYHEAKPVGCCIILMVGKKVSIPWASTRREYNRLAPNMLLYWNALKFSCDEGYSSFDFGRSSSGEGTFKFKQQWGAAPQPLRWFSTQQDLPPREGNEYNRSSKRETIAKAWSNLPLTVTKITGPLIRKYINL